MREYLSKRNLIIISIIIFCVALYFIYHKPGEEMIVENIPVTETVPFESEEIIGKSVEGRDIESYTFGNGETNLVFVGGIHGGYEWNSTYLAYRFIDFLKENSDFVPSNMKVTVIPTANPDGLFKITGKVGRFTVDDAPDTTTSGAGRFNANDVDLNRNFDCKWKPESTWQNKVVSAGTSAFSEPEAQAIKNFVEDKKPKAFVFWHSKANAVYASECTEGILPETLDIMKAYSLSSGYTAVESFDAYEVTGDVEGWLASIGIPAITVELRTHESIEWGKNLAGIKALVEYYKE